MKWLLPLLSLCALPAFGQADSTLVRYQGGFDFHEGIYFTFDQFRRNAPGVPLKDLMTDQGQHVADLKQSNGKLEYVDSAGAKQHIDLDRVWGFCNKDVVYVRAGDGFNRIGLMGSIAHVMFDATYRNWGGYYGYGYGGSTYTVEEQRLLDLETGAFLPVTAGGIYAVIQRDAVLREEFDALPKKEKKSDEVVFRFMRRYNDRHPLYFPR